MFKKTVSSLLLGMLCAATVPAMAEDSVMSAPPPVDDALLMPPSLESTSAGAVPVQQNIVIADASASHSKVKSVNILKELESRARAGDAKCQFTLGRMYAIGDGVRQDKQEALRWYRKAALQKYAPALAAMGIAYRDGHGVQKHRVYAAVLMSEAAEYDSRFEKEALELQDQLSMQEQMESESAEEILKKH